MLDSLVVQLTRDQARSEVEKLSREHLCCPSAEPFRRLDAEELDDYAISDELRGYRHLLRGSV